MRTDMNIRQDVEREPEWDPSVDERRIGVSVVDGVVTLSAEIGSFSEKWNAGPTAERVNGVRGGAHDTDVHAA